MNIKCLLGKHEYVFVELVGYFDYKYKCRHCGKIKIVNELLN